MADVSEGQVGVVHPEGHAKESAGKAQQMNAATMLYLENDSGGTLVSGDVVVLEADAKVNTTATEGLKAVVAVCATNFDGTAQSIADGDSGYFQVVQWCPAVKVDGATTIGQWLNTSTTAKKANQTAAASEPPTGTFGVALTAHASVVEAVLIQGMGWGSPAHVAATTNIHGVGTSVSPVGHYGATFRFESKQITGSLTHDAANETAFTWDQAFTALVGVVAHIRADANLADDALNSSVELEEVDETGGNAIYVGDHDGAYIVDILGWGTD